MLVRVSCGSCGGELYCQRTVEGTNGEIGGRRRVGGAKPCDTTNATCSVLLCRRCPRGFDMI